MEKKVTISETSLQLGMRFTSCCLSLLYVNNYGSKHD